MPFVSDPIGKPGLLLLGIGYLLNVTRHVLGAIHLPSPALLGWTGFTCTCIGGIYYLLKIYFDFIQKTRK